jgi:N-acetylglucosaminyldiphosphoundecaprenol N-acetyl-beta-D-mannosaminyltransferase
VFTRHVIEQRESDGLQRRFFNFAGVGIEALTYGDMEARIDRWIAKKSDRSHHIACLNAYCVALSLRNGRLKDIYGRSDIPGADGMPFVHWLRWVLNTRCDRLAGMDIAHYLAERSQHTGYTFYLYGGAPEVLEEVRVYLEARFPHIEILGVHSPPFRELTVEEDEAICEEISRLQPDVIFVGLGTPKQDYWIDSHLERLRGSVMVASGAMFDFFGGRVRIAPPWIRTSGFEWLYRLLGKDFWRLLTRYTHYHFLFSSRFLLQMVGLREYPVDRPSRSCD